MTADESMIAHVATIRGTREHVRTASFPPGALVGQVSCIECDGSGWWGYGPVEEVNGHCVDCKGTGRVWVGLA